MNRPLNNRTKKNYALLVDGYARDLFATGMILQRLDYEVFIANSGKDALKLIDVSLPDLVITELSLQNMSGLELLFHLKRTAATKDIPSLFIRQSGTRSGKSIAVRLDVRHFSCSRPL